jgi:hypothetical protein
MEWKEYKDKVKDAISAGDFDGAEKMLMAALEHVRTSGDDSHERVCLCLDQLGWIYVNQKDLDKAEGVYKESMEIKRNVLGMDNPIVARACKKLATVVYLQKKFDLAEKYSKDALNIFKTTLGADNEETKQTLDDLVSLLRKLGRNVEATIVEKGGKASSSSAPESQSPHYEPGQTFIRIKVCVNCNLPYDGDRCMRCSDSSVPSV